jgi:hypothetical protein
VSSIWSWIEYFVLYDSEKPQLKPDSEKFNYGQDRTAKIWLALVTVLLGLYFGKDFARESATPNGYGTEGRTSHKVSSVSMLA